MTTDQRKSGPIFGIRPEVLLAHCLKPEEVQEVGSLQAKRVLELLAWFSRFADGHANPKWLRGHAFELAYVLSDSSGMAASYLALAEEYRARAERAEAALFRECGFARTAQLLDGPTEEG